MPKISYEKRLQMFHDRIVVDEKSQCWNWVGPKTNGYGVASVDNKRTLAHRSYWLFIGKEIPESYDLDHLCRNRGCINPDHLEPVTRSENLKRGFLARGCKNGHPYIESDFSVVKRSDGTTELRCKKCHRERNSRSKMKKSQDFAA